MGKHSPTIGAYIVHSAAGTVYAQFAGASYCETSEDRYDCDVHTDFVWDRMWLYCDSFSATNTVVRNRINGVNGSLAITVAGTGGYADNSNHNDVVAGDDVNLMSTQTGSGATVIQQVRTDIETTDSENTNLFLGLDQYAGDTCPSGLNGSGYPDTNTAKLTIRHECTAKYLHINVYLHSAVVATLYLNKNTVNGNPQITVPASATGHYSDDSNTMSLTSGDVVYVLQVCTGGLFAYRGYIVLQNTVNTIFLNQYYMIFTTSAHQSSIFGGTSDTAIYFESGYKGMLSKAGLSVQGNNASMNSTLRLYKNAVAQSIIITITAGATGVFEDTTNSVVNTASDQLSWYSSAIDSGKIIKVWEANVQLTGWFHKVDTASPAKVDTASSFLRVNTIS